MIVAFCLKCGKRLELDEMREGIKRNRRGICLICLLKEELDGSENDT